MIATKKQQKQEKKERCRKTVRLWVFHFPVAHKMLFQNIAYTEKHKLCVFIQHIYFAEFNSIENIYSIS